MCPLGRDYIFGICCRAREEEERQTGRGFPGPRISEDRAAFKEETEEAQLEPLENTVRLVVDKQIFLN